MAKESLYGVSSNLIFRETFNSFDDIAKNGGVHTSLTLNNGVGVFNGATTTLNYVRKITTGISIRIKFKSLTLISATQYIIGSNPDTFYIYISNTGVLSKSSGTNYVDGIASSAITNNTKEVIVTGMTSNLLHLIMYVLSNSAGNFKLTANVELIEIYKGTLTAIEVLELYKGTLYKTFKDSSELFHINAYRGVINDLITPSRVIAYSGGLPRVRNIIGTRNVIEINSVTLLPITPLINVFSLSMWVKRYSVGYTVNSFLVRGEGGTSKTYLVSGGSTSLIWQGSTSGSVAATGIDFNKNFIHVVVTYNNGVVQFYINGVANASGNVVGGIINTSIGPSNTFGAPAYNVFVNFRMFNNKILTATEATRIYWSEKTKFKISN